MNIEKNSIEWAKNYIHTLNKTYEKVDLKNLQVFIEVIEDAINLNNIIYSFGNGGSAAISNHLLCDFSKGISTNTCLNPRVVSLSSSSEIITALMNDIGPESIFEGQLKNILRAGDICIAISSSGNSDNIIRAVKFAKLAGAKVLGMAGFDGGQLVKLADFSIHVPSTNYGIVEDIHQSLMHLISQYLNKKHHE
jgi:D-sedoheptulose 7-phosphate isomerase